MLAFGVAGADTEVLTLKNTEVLTLKKNRTMHTYTFHLKKIFFPIKLIGKIILFQNRTKEFGYIACYERKWQWTCCLFQFVDNIQEYPKEVYYNTQL